MQVWTAGPPGTFPAPFGLIPFFLLLSQGVLAGQTLSLSRATAAPGEQVSIEISFQAPSGREPAALQWETVLPAQLTFLDETMPAGPAAKAAGKSVTCAVKTKAGESTSTCILYGGQEPLHNGVIAVLRLKVSPTAQSGIVRIRVGQAAAVSKDLQKTPLDPVEAAIKIQTK